jgi:hypothetical protein
VLIPTWWTAREVSADRLRGHRGPSARCLTAQLFFVFVRVLERLSFDLFVGGFLVHEVCGRSVLECRTVCDEADSPRVHHRRTVFLGAILEVRVAISDGPCPHRGQSVRTLRTVRLVLSRLPKSLAF